MILDDDDDLVTKINDQDCVLFTDEYLLINHVEMKAVFHVHRSNKRCRLNSNNEFEFT